MVIYLLVPFADVSLNEHGPSKVVFLTQNIYISNIDRKADVYGKERSEIYCHQTVQPPCWLKRFLHISSDEKIEWWRFHDVGSQHEAVVCVNCWCNSHRHYNEAELGLLHLRTSNAIHFQVLLPKILKNAQNHELNDTFFDKLLHRGFKDLPNLPLYD